MGLYNGNPPMGLGEVLKGTDEDGNLLNAHWLGLVFDLPVPPTSTNKKRPTGHTVKAVLLRNVSGFTMLGKRLASVRASAGYPQVEEVDGYAITLAQKGCVVVDSWLPSTGVPDDDIFWGIIKGPCEVLTGFTGAVFNGDVAVAGQLVAATYNGTTGNSEAGRVSNVTLPGQTGETQAFAMAANLLGCALSARTTGETNAALLVQVQMDNRF